jgi:hypothetical protein
MIDIKVDVTGLEELAAKFAAAAKSMPAAISHALNRTGDQVTTAIGRTLADETGMHVHDVRDAMTQDKSTAGNLEYVITISGAYQPLSEFDPHETAKGFSARPWGQRRVFPHTFGIPNAPDHVFVRAGRARFPIHELWGPSLGVEAGRGETEAVARDKAAEVFPVRMAHEVARILPGSGDGGDGGGDTGGDGGE